MIASRFFALLLALVPSAGAEAAVLADQPYHLDRYDRPVTHLTINGQGPFSFVLDTASSGSFMFTHLRNKLQLPPTGEPFNTYGLSKVVKSDPLTLDEVKLSGLTYRQMRMGVLESTMTADGILGIDAVDKYTLVLDRAQMRFQLISADDTGAHPWRQWTALDMTPAQLRSMSGTLWTVPASINNRGFTAILDLGAGITVINWPAAEMLGIERREFVANGPPDKRLRDMLGTTAPAINILADIKVGDQTFSGERILVADAQVFDFMGLGKTPAAIIGTGLLRDHSVAVDFPARKFYLGQRVQSK